MGKERMALKRFDHGDNAIMATNSQVISLGNIVGKDNPGTLSDSGEHGQKNAAL
jgi:hypothetical protein